MRRSISVANAVASIESPPAPSVAQSSIEPRNRRRRKCNGQKISLDAWQITAITNKAEASTASPDG